MSSQNECISIGSVSTTVMETGLVIQPEGQFNSPSLICHLTNFHLQEVTGRFFNLSFWLFLPGIRKQEIKGLNGELVPALVTT